MLPSPGRRADSTRGGGAGPATCTTCTPACGMGRWQRRTGRRGRGASAAGECSSCTGRSLPATRGGAKAPGPRRDALTCHTLPGDVRCTGTTRAAAQRQHARGVRATRPPRVPPTVGGRGVGRSAKRLARRGVVSRPSCTGEKVGRHCVSGSAPPGWRKARPCNAHAFTECAVQPDGRGRRARAAGRGLDGPALHDPAAALRLEARCHEALQGWPVLSDIRHDRDLPRRVVRRKELLLLLLLRLPFPLRQTPMGRPPGALPQTKSARRPHRTVG